MGIHSSFDFHHPLLTPPESGSQSASLYNVGSSEERAWRPVAPISPSMSSDDHRIKSEMSAGKGSEGEQARREAQDVPRQQLPSLSSLFGPPSHIRPLHSPLSDRPSPLYSPLDRPHSASANSHRSYSNSYFPPVSTPGTQTRSIYEPRLEHERASYPSSAPLFPGPISPRISEYDQSRTVSRNDSILSAPLSSQSSSPGARRSEYVFGSREPLTSFRPVNARLPFSALGQSQGIEPMAGYREQHQIRSVLPSRTSSSSITGTSEGAPAKDGLGPKIWTGTHFLPRFVRQAEVPGERLCYFYDDRSHCKSVIDGEPVNAHWGVTKAGKPRKRLAIACLTCREKKIKCDPDFPRCLQCEKFGRVCKFKNAPRGGHNTSPTTSLGEHEEPRPLASQPRQVDGGRPRVTSSPSISPRTTTTSHPSPGQLSPASKRIRIGYERYETTTSYEPHRPVSQDTGKANLSWHQRDLPRIHEDVLGRAWQTDPYVSNPQAAATIITAFFNHIETTALRFLPAQLIKDWVRSNAHTKTSEDLTLLYSMLALGLHVSGGSKDLAHEYAQVARYACERSAPGLQLVQSRLILSLFHLANARGFESYDTLSGAISAALSLQFHRELDYAPDGNLATFPYGMNRITYAETRRRTLFSCFMLERMNGLFPTRPTLLRAEEIFLRLPQSEKAFDQNMREEQDTPMLNVRRELPSFTAAVGIMGYLVHIIDIWGRIVATLREIDPDPKHLDELSARLRRYQEVLPVKFRFSDPNLARASEDGVVGSMITQHLVLLLAKTKFSRYLESNTSRATHGTIALAGDLMFAVTAVRDQLVARRRDEIPFLPPTMVAPAAIEAVDVLSASGPVSSVGKPMREAQTAQDVLNAVSSVWENVKAQRIILDERAHKLHLIRERATMALDPIPGCEIYRARDVPEISNLMFRILEPMEERLGTRRDAVYGMRG